MRNYRNGLPSKAGWKDPEFISYAQELHLVNAQSGIRNRLDWQKVMVLKVLNEKRLINPGSMILNIAGGTDVINYYLASRINKLITIDLYDNSWESCPKDMVTNPWKYPPFDYKRENLIAMNMDARNLLFERDTFDAVIIIDSLNYMGDFEQAVSIISGVHRILKKGGILILTVEFTFEPVPSGELYFTNESLMDFLSRIPFLLEHNPILDAGEFAHKDRANPVLPPRTMKHPTAIRAGTIGVRPGLLKRNFPYFRILRPKLFPLLLVLLSDK